MSQPCAGWCTRALSIQLGAFGNAPPYSTTSKDLQTKRDHITNHKSITYTNRISAGIILEKYGKVATGLGLESSRCRNSTHATRGVLAVGLFCMKCSNVKQGENECSCALAVFSHCLLLSSLFA